MNLTLLDLHAHLTRLLDEGVANPHSLACISQNGRLHPIASIDPLVRPVTDVFPPVVLAFGGK